MDVVAKIKPETSKHTQDRLHGTLKQRRARARRTLFIRSCVLTPPFKHHVLVGHELTFHINKIHATLTS